MPFSFKLEKRLEPSRKISFLVPILSFILALLFGALLLALVGAPPVETYRAMLEGAFGSLTQVQGGEFYAVSETLVRAVPLMFTGLSVSIAFRMLFWNMMVPRPIPQDLAGRLVSLDRLANDLHARDKGFFYQRLYIAEVR